MHEHWGDQISELADAYLLFKFGQGEPSENLPEDDTRTLFNVLAVEISCE